MTFVLYCAHLALSLLRQDRLHLSNKNKNPKAFYFVLHSVCTIFAIAKIGCGSEEQK